MKKLLLIASTFLSVHSFAICTQTKPVIKIGCAYSCNFFYKFALKRFARNFNYHLEIHDMPNSPLGALDYDGILIPGGADIDPKYYMSKVPQELANYTKEHLSFVKFSEEGKIRDPYEYKLVTEYFSKDDFKDTPMLGICRGMQMLAVASSLPLYVDLKHELGIRNRYNTLDKVLITDSDSLMSDFYPRDRTYGVKFHHQGVRMSYYNENEHKFPNLKITAHSKNGLIGEAIEFKNRIAMGVQYHPEKAIYPGNGKPIWNWFLTHSCEKSNSRH